MAGNSFHSSCDLMGCPYVLASHCKVSLLGWTAEVVSLRRCQKVPLCLIEAMSPGSKTELPLEAKPVSAYDGGSDSRIMYFRKGKNCWETAPGRELWGYVREAAVNTWRMWGRRYSRHQSKDSPAAHGAAHGEPLHSIEVHGGADIWRWAGGVPTGHYDSGKITLEQGPGRTCEPMERRAHGQAGFLAGLVTLRRALTGAPVPEELHSVEGAW